MKAPFRGSATRPRDVLRQAEKHAVVIRKLLKEFEQGQGRIARGGMDDAVKLAETIESLARLGQSCSVADAVEVEFQVESLTSLLEVEIDHILAP